MNKQLTDQNVSTTVISSVNENDRTPAIGTLMLAFAADPQIRFLFPDPLQYQAHAFDFFKAFGGNAFKFNSAHQINGFSGTALWLPPDTHPDEQYLLDVIQKGVESSTLPTVMAVLEQMEEYQPDEPHWHLPLIGIDPPKQGNGYGSALLQYALDLIDRQEEIAYLENSNPLNTPLYERHGFEVLGTIQVDDAPPMYPMIRYPT